MVEQTNQINNGKKVDFKIFIWVIGVIVVVFGYLFTEVSALGDRVENTNDDIVIMKTDIAEIKTDLKWIVNKFQSGQINR